MATEPKNGGAVARAGGAEILAARAAVEGEQVELFALPVADATGDIERAAAAARGPGRPAGSSNKATVAFRDYLLRRGVLPQEAAMKWVMMGPEGVAVWMAGGRAGAVTADIRIEAFKAWSKVAADLGRYFMSPMVPVDGTGKALPMFNVVINGGSGVVDQAGNVRPPWEYIEVEGNQELSEAIDGESQLKESKE